jgi:hypothetical protein
MTMITDDEYLKLNENLKTHFENVEGVYLGTDPGWYNLIYTLTNCIDHHVAWQNRVNRTDTKVKISQIKEKFGGLRYYIESGDKTIFGMIQLAEALSFTICEECGQPGKLRSGGWMKTLCDKHEEERQARYKGLDE